MNNLDWPESWERYPEWIRAVQEEMDKIEAVEKEEKMRLGERENKWQSTRTIGSGW